MNIREAAARLQVSERTLWHYLRRSYPEPEEEPTDIIEMFKDVLKKLRGRVDELLARPVSYQDEKMLAMNISSLEKLGMDLAKLERKISEAPLVQIQHIEIQYNKLQQFMLENLCSECQDKLVKYLEAST